MALKEVCPDDIENAPSYDAAYNQLKTFTARKKQLELSRKKDLTEIGKNEYEEINRRLEGLESILEPEDYQIILARVQQEEEKPSYDFILDQWTAIVNEIKGDFRL